MDNTKLDELESYVLNIVLPLNTTGESTELNYITYMFFWDKHLNKTF